MSAQVIPLVTESAVDEAWKDLAKHRERLVSDAVSALRDREWVEEDARLHRRFCRLLAIQEGVSA